MLVQQVKMKKVTVILLLVVPTITGQFGYAKWEQHMWSQKFKFCAGKLQSPIAISSAKAISYPLPALETVGYHNLLPSQAIIRNTGLTVSLTINKTFLLGKSPYIFGAVFDKNEIYEMDGLHFHWGGKNDRGSEHILNGVRYPMEMHIVHRNTKYQNESVAVQYENGLSVLGIFFQLQEEDNVQLNPILNALTHIKWLNTETQLNTSITLASLLPVNTDMFYTYKGSLTTPPCYEVVTWIIFPTPVPISYRQMSKFRTLSNGEETLVDNYRHLQKIGLRKVYVRKLNSFFTVKYNPLRFNAPNLSWIWQ